MGNLKLVTAPIVSSDDVPRQSKGIEPFISPAARGKEHGAADQGGRNDRGYTFVESDDQTKSR